MNKNKLHVFGDSFSQTFKSHKESNSSWFLNYYNHTNEVPENFSEILSNHLNYELVNHSIGGSSNYTIFDTFLKNVDMINENDIIIFGWTAINRFRIASNTNNFIDILPFTSNPKQNDDVSLITTHEIAINRDSYSIWWKEIENFVKIIKLILKNNQIYHWTWESPKTNVSYNIWSEDSMERKIVMIAETWKNVDMDVKNAITSSCDYIFDLTKDFSIEEVRKLNNEGKKIFFINREIAPLSILGPVCSNFNYTIYNTTNHKKECYRNFIPYFKYETIKEETNGAVDDIHYGKYGHQELAKTFIEIIETNKKPII